MGDGGVACMPLQHIMEKFPGSEAYCGGGGNVNGKLATKSSVKTTDTEMMKKLKKDSLLKTEKREFGFDKPNSSNYSGNHSNINNHIKNIRSGNTTTNKNNIGTETANGDSGPDKLLKDEVEEGELGTLKSPIREVSNGELEKPLRAGSEKGEVEKSEFYPRKWRRGEREKSIFNSGRLQSDTVFRRDHSPETGTANDEIEKGEFIPDRWHGRNFPRDEFDYSRPSRYDSGRDRNWRPNCDWTPPSGKCLFDGPSSGKDFGKGILPHPRRTARWEIAQERSYGKLSSKIVDEGSSRKNEHHDKNHGREQSSGSRLKRHANEPERHIYQQADYVSAKSRRLSGGDTCRSAAHTEHFSLRSAERSNRNFSSSRGGAQRHSGRHHDYSPSSKLLPERSLHERGGRHRDHKDRSPVHPNSPLTLQERSPRERGSRHREHRDCTPVHRERSPYDRVRHHDRRNRNPVSAELSSPGRGRARAGKDQFPSLVEQVSCAMAKPHGEQELSHNKETSETGLNFKPEEEDKSLDGDAKINDQSFQSNESKEEGSVLDGLAAQFVTSKTEEIVPLSLDGSAEKTITPQIDKGDSTQLPGLKFEEKNEQANGFAEEPSSMEEDMDICDTPPHVPFAAEATVGKWYYLDHHGIERGPSRLCDLKALVEGGFLMSDHMVKYFGGDRWVTVENAASPPVSMNFSTVVSDAITQMVSPPEPTGNLLADLGDSEAILDHSSLDRPGGMEKLISHPDNVSDNHHIDDRVEALLGGVDVVPGKELEALGEVMRITFSSSEWETWANSQGLMPSQILAPAEQDGQDISKPESSKDAEAYPASANLDNDSTYHSSEFSEWFSVRWPCKGDDWCRNEDAALEWPFRKKVMLNDGYPLCQMAISGIEDPRSHRRDDLYYPAQSRKLDLPPWAFSLPEEKNDVNVTGQPGHPKPVLAKGVKGTVLPVVRINACVVRDRGSFVSDPRSRMRSKERQSLKSSRPSSSSSNDCRRSSAERALRSKSVEGGDSEGSSKATSSFDLPKDRLCTKEELQLHAGDWHYLDGAGREHGPYLYSELQGLVDRGLMLKDSSVFRKKDQLWVPITPSKGHHRRSVKLVEESKASAYDSSVDSQSGLVSSSFHSLHPQFIGYTRGKLHELVMRSYKIREFAAAINEVLDPWINAKQPKKETEKHLHIKAPTSDGDTYLAHENQIRGLKRARLTIDSSDEDHELTEHFATFLRDESSFDDVCESATFALNEVKCSKTEIDGWGLLDGHVLARIFHFLRADVKSMIVAGSTCRHWRASVGFYKDISRLVDLSIIGSNCTDQVIKSIMIGYNIEKVKALVLVDCANVTSGALEEIIGSFSHISCIDIRGCSQFDDLVSRYPHISWVKRRGKLNSQPKMKSLDQISGKASYVASASCVDDSVGLRAYFDRAEMKAFKPSMYRRNKLYDPRKSASISSRDAQMRRKSAIGFKRIEESVLLNLRNIMKDNTFEIFVPKVSEIEDRIKGGYYAGRGLTLIKEDIQRMCRDAVKNRGAAGDMDRIVAQFINLATSLQGSKLWTHRDEIMKKLRDDSTCNVMGKRRSKTLVDRKYSHRSNGASFPNGSSDFSEYSSDRELKNRLSKLNKKSWNYTNESSDESEFSAYSGSDSRLTDSDTQSDSDIRSDGVARGRQDDYLRVGGGFDLLADEREWGARMTKASLVPPVTRKYDVITEYLIVADEKEVRRKMRVSLPDDYEEKVKAQKSGTEETDMEIPEVKEFKPRKQPGDEVIEQEVYGIDPYTHNLILDSMPAVDGWSLHEKHQFVENVILRTLNKQVRDFTGSSNTPMTYPLRHVIHEIVETARAHGDMRTLGLCEPLLEAIDNRVEDKYVAYRKGLGVVCNKDGGIEKDDFVVEFLGEVYPAWKWYEKQDGIRSLQKNTKDPAPEFYNINLERPKGDADGYDLVVVDAMHKANYASRICHSCQPNCEAKVTAVDGHYQIGIYTVRPILFGEEITFDYNSVTESKEEYEASVCLCGSQVCRGSYLNLTGEGAFQKVLQEKHGLLDRHTLMLEACELNWVSEEDYLELGRAGLGSCLLDGLPDWLIAYSARLVRFINVERTLLPREIFKHNVDEKSKYFTEICLEVEKSDAEVQAEGVYNQRLQNLALTLDKVRYVLRCVFGDPKKAPPPLQKLSLEETISYLWKGDGSLVQDLLQSMAPHVESTDLETLKVDIRALDPSVSDDPEKELHKSLLWLRDKVRSLPCGVKSRHDAAADLIHVYAHTKSFFKIREYKSVTSPPVYISPLDLGPKYADKISGLTEYRKTYNKNYCLGQLIFWENQANADPDRTLARASRGCLALPDVGSFYAKPQKPSRSRIYGHKTVRFMVSRMVKQPQRPWPKDRIWEFKEFPRVLGSPMLDALLLNKDDPVVDSDMVRWLKNRPGIFHTSTDL